MTIYPQLLNISPEIILILQNMLIYVIQCRESHLRTFCREIHQCARIGGWGLSKFWQSQDFGSACYSNSSLSDYNFNDPIIQEQQLCLVQSMPSSVNSVPVKKDTLYNYHNLTSSDTATWFSWQLA